MTTIAERVAAGAAFLDGQDPGWWREIDLESLDLGEPDLCVLGQRCPLTVLAAYCSTTPDDPDLAHESWRNYTAYAEALSGIQADGESVVDLIEWGDRHGFSNSASWNSYPELTAEWQRVITTRREATS